MDYIGSWMPFGAGVLTAIFIGVFGVIFFYTLKWLRQDTEELDDKKKDYQYQKGSTSSANATSKLKREQTTTVKKHQRNLTEREGRRGARAGNKAFQHAWLLGSLKGHGKRVLDMDLAANGKYLVSCDDDRTIFIWDTKDFSVKDRKSLRINVEFDYATKVKWSPDCKAFIAQRYSENVLEVYKVEKKKDGWLSASKVVTFPKEHETDVIGLGIASTGKYIMTCSNKTDIVIWTLKGEVLSKFDNYLMNTTCAKISPCGKFVVASGFIPEAKVWEVVFDKSGEFKEVIQTNALTLGGHSSGVYDVAFDVDSSHMATVSKDGTWKLFDTNVNYKQNQNAKLIRTGKYEQSGNHALIALSPNSEVLVIATYSDLQFFSTMTGELDNTIENVSDDPITSITFDSSGNHLLVAADKQVKIFHNITGYKCAVVTAKEKLKEHQTSATKERLQQLIKHHEEFLKNF